MLVFCIYTQYTGSFDGITKLLRVQVSTGIKTARDNVNNVMGKSIPRLHYKLTLGHTIDSVRASPAPQNARSSSRHLTCSHRPKTTSNRTCTRTYLHYAVTSFIFFRTWQKNAKKNIERIADDDVVSYNCSAVVRHTTYRTACFRRDVINENVGREAQAKRIGLALPWLPYLGARCSVLRMRERARWWPLLTRWWTLLDRPYRKLLGGFYRKNEVYYNFIVWYLSNRVL